ncbi:MAG: hypothetical protein OEV59_07085 [Deltaproteobacteria bacterium]|nr:hypothetical protein [Deltaproteobacteria bacterium]
MKKTLCAFILLAAVTIFITGCGDKKEKPSGEPTGSTTGVPNYSGVMEKVHDKAGKVNESVEKKDALLKE